MVKTSAQPLSLSMQSCQSLAQVSEGYQFLFSTMGKKHMILSCWFRWSHHNPTALVVYLANIRTLSITCTRNNTHKILDLKKYLRTLIIKLNTKNSKLIRQVTAVQEALASSHRLMLFQMLRIGAVLHCPTLELTHLVEAVVQIINPEILTKLGVDPSLLVDQNAILKLFQSKIARLVIFRKLSRTFRP